MFSSVGWGEILVLLIVGLLLIGPERLPGLIKEVRAVLLAIRNAVGEARQQLDGEFGEDIKQLSKPLAELNNVRQMGARGLLTKTLLEGDDSLLKPFDSTAQQVKDTVETVRKPNLRDALRGEGQQGTVNPNTASTSATTSSGDAPAADSVVPVTGQGAVGESRDQSSPIQETAQRMAQEQNQARVHAPQGQPNYPGSEQNAQSPGSQWDDVI